MLPYSLFCGLLQHHPCWGVQVHRRQASGSTECCCSHCQRHTQVWPRGLSYLLHTELHWLDVPQRVHYKLCGVTVHQRLQSTAKCCTQLCNITSWQHLRSASGCLYRVVGVRCFINRPSLSLAQWPGNLLPNFRHVVSKICESTNT